jgi:hypothetical protein
MALLDSLFGKKKKEIRAICPITKEPIEKGFGYLLTTAEVVCSKRFWDMVMTEPETLAYTQQHFSNNSNGTQMRSLIFEKKATVMHPWIVSDSIISIFDVDKQEARDRVKKWWESQGSYSPDNVGPAAEKLDGKAFTDWKNYAILEAGRDFKVRQKVG